MECYTVVSSGHAGFITNLGQPRPRVRPGHMVPGTAVIYYSVDVIGALVLRDN